MLKLRGGLDINKIGHVEVGRAVYEAARITRKDRARDVICPNYLQNIIVVSTPTRENVNRDVNVTGIFIQDKRTRSVPTSPARTAW